MVRARRLGWTTLVMGALVFGACSSADDTPDAGTPDAGTPDAGDVPDAGAVAAPTVTIELPGSVFANQPALFSASATSPSEEATQAGFAFTFAWGDDSTNTVPAFAGNGSGVEKEHTYSASGTYELTVTATDKFGVTGTKKASVQADAVPSSCDGCTRAVCSAEAAACQADETCSSALTRYTFCWNLLGSDGGTGTLQEKLSCVAGLSSGGPLGEAFGRCAEPTLTAACASCF